MKFGILVAIALGVVGALVYLPSVACDPCAGDGQVESRVQTVKCGVCGGKGTRKSMSSRPGVKALGGTKPMCLTCKGRGVVSQQVSDGGTCLTCKGGGKLSVYAKFTQKTE